MNKELPFRKTVVSHVVNLQYSLMLPIKQTSSALLRLSKSCWKSTRDNNCCHHTMFIFNQVMKNVWHSKHRLSPQDTVTIPPSSRPPIHPCKIMLCVWCQIAHQQGKWSLWTCTLQHLATRIATEGASTLFLRGNIKLHAV